MRYLALGRNIYWLLIVFPKVILSYPHPLIGNLVKRVAVPHFIYSFFHFFVTFASDFHLSWCRLNGGGVKQRKEKSWEFQNWTTQIEKFKYIPFNCDSQMLMYWRPESHATIISWDLMSFPLLWAIVRVQGTKFELCQKTYDGSK